VVHFIIKRLPPSYKEDCVFNLSDIINIAVRIEKNGEKTYRKAGIEASDPLISSILEQLADDELEHEKWFNSLKEHIESTDIDPALEEMGGIIIRGVLGEEAFSISEVDFSKIENIKTLLEKSIEFEMDTILFYEMINAFIENNETIKNLAMIIDEENRHVQQLTEWLEKGCPPLT